MSMREIDLNENIINSNEGNQERQEYYIPDLNANIEELDVGFIQSPSTSILQCSSSRGCLPFDLNDEPVMEDDEQVGDIMQQSNSNNSEYPSDSRSSSQSFDFNDDELEDIMYPSDSHLEEDSVDDVTSSQVTQAPTRKKSLCNEDRMAIYNTLLGKSVEGRLIRGAIDMVKSQFSVSRSTIQRIWKQGRNSGVYVDVSHKLTKNVGRKRIQVDFNRLRDIPMRKRTSIRSTSSAMNMSKSTLHRYLKMGVLRKHSNAVKPFLREENKKSRLQFCISMLDASSLPHDPTFLGMYNIIHIDEKWFQMTKKSQNYYLLPDEEDPLRTCKSKNFIGKVMFLAATARPRFDAEKRVLFDGKIGIFPLVTEEPAKRSSVNRAAGTLETKPITSVTKQVIRSYMIEKVLPAIKEKWPREDRCYPIFIQQDNARTHIDINDEEFCRAASQDGFDIRLMYQPANSPDLNVLDLGYFRAIQSIQHTESPNSIDELVKAVEHSFEIFSPWKSNRIFLSLQMCMIEIMKNRGSNKFKTPHLKKESLERRGQLPTRLKCDAALVQDVLKYLE
ncbi:mariner transposase [Trifolium pratense]|uniref:Mariner transposase n=1 Tax=Trifolium pratense TaxID=57577 RepID=A0A2K3L9U3_TRIPR|nr:mariner transposase [Trifolium pratense]